MTRTVRLSASFHEVLWYGDGPQLLLLTMGAKSFVLAVAVDKVCEDAQFFGAKISHKQLDSYLRNRFDLRYCLSTPDRHQWFLFDFAEDSEKIPLRNFEFDKDKHESLLPDHRVFAVDHSETFSLTNTQHNFTQRYYVDGKWDVKEFSKFHSQLSDLYALSDGIDVFTDQNVGLDVKRDLVEAFLKPWRGGGSYLAFFKSVSKFGGTKAKPELSAITWASPGHMDILGNEKSFEKIDKLLGHFDEHRVLINEVYKDLWSFLSEMKLLTKKRDHFDRQSEIAKEVNERTKTFSEVLGLAPYRTLKQMAGNDPLVAAKVLLAAKRRVEKMHRFFLEGRVSTKDSDIG